MFLAPIRTCNLFRYGDIREYPVFARSGAIIPITPAPDHLEIVLFSGADNFYTENTTSTRADVAGFSIRTSTRNNRAQQCSCHLSPPHLTRCSFEMEIRIRPEQQQSQLATETWRALSVTLRSCKRPCKVELLHTVTSVIVPRKSLLDSATQEAPSPSSFTGTTTEETSWFYWPNSSTLSIGPINNITSEEIVIRITGALPADSFLSHCTCGASPQDSSELSASPSFATVARKMLARFAEVSSIKKLVEKALVANLQPFGMDSEHAHDIMDVLLKAPLTSSAQIQALVESICGCGAYYVESGWGVNLRRHLVLFNRYGLPHMKLHPENIPVPVEGKTFLWCGALPSSSIMCQCGNLPPMTFPPRDPQDNRVPARVETDSPKPTAQPRTVRRSSSVIFNETSSEYPPTDSNSDGRCVVM